MHSSHLLCRKRLTARKKGVNEMPVAVSETQLGVIAQVFFPGPIMGNHITKGPLKNQEDSWYLNHNVTHHPEKLGVCLDPG
jgi:hypothetical protein